jgi:hypothetical protein
METGMRLKKAGARFSLFFVNDFLLVIQRLLLLVRR